MNDTKRQSKAFHNPIICAGNLEVLKQLPDNCIDLVLTSLPYSFGVVFNELNRNYIGIDISEKYCNKARNRLESG